LKTALFLTKSHGKRAVILSGAGLGCLFAGAVTPCPAAHEISRSGGTSISSETYFPFFFRCSVNKSINNRHFFA
jgi:hypothetical protein